FDRAIELDNDYKWAIASRGETYQLMQRYEEALADFDRAIELDNDYKWAIASRGEIYLLLHQYGRALADFNTAIDIEANDWRYYGRALAYLSLRDKENAKANLTQAIQLAQQDYQKDASNYRNTLNLALYFLVACKLDRAKHFYQDALSQRPSTFLISEAIQDLQDLLTIFPNYPSAEEIQIFLQRQLQELEKLSR
ncbi:MAG: tetratricopeptide repeat protein, partial [Leptolyngbya sp. SIO4C1]|nr:tetratricopeptide repeat protein [Leptolyngbya sp. SIO4C1]